VLRSRVQGYTTSKNEEESKVGSKVQGPGGGRGSSRVMHWLVFVCLFFPFNFKHAPYLNGLSLVCHEVLCILDMSIVLCVCNLLWRASDLR
jgi:hypothetical protein